jgi:hypothetical protein
MERITPIKRSARGTLPDTVHVTTYLAATGLEGNACRIGHGFDVLMVDNIAAADAVQVVLSRADAGNQQQSRNCRHSIISVRAGHDHLTKRFESAFAYSPRTMLKRNVTTRKPGFKLFLALYSRSYLASRPHFGVLARIKSVFSQKKLESRQEMLYVSGREQHLRDYFDTR